MPAPLSAPDRALRADVLLTSEAETLRLAEGFAALVGAGDTLLLDGPIGAGKTFFARALIGALQARAGVPREDVPSPTFTLVQTYQAGDLEIWHADLYRLTTPDESVELGLDEAFGSALCLIEWPDRLGARTPAEALWLGFAPEEDADGTAADPASIADPGRRRLTLAGPAPWAERLGTLLESLDA